MEMILHYVHTFCARSGKRLIQGMYTRKCWNLGGSSQNSVYSNVLSNCKVQNSSPYDHPQFLTKLKVFWVNKVCP